MITLFRAAMAMVKTTPEPAARAVFRAVGYLAGLSNAAGAVQLRKNLARVCPGPTGWAERRRSARSMALYLEYYYEAFRLPYLTREQINARVRFENGDALRDHLAAGHSASAALLHMGNWDLAGAWATEALAPVFSIAEKLEPPEMAQLFLDFRQDIGMTIYQAIPGGGAIGKLERHMREGNAFVPLLCDRDLSASGVEVELLGHALRVAVGSALLAQRTGEPMFPITIVHDFFKSDKARVARAGSCHGIRLIIGEPIHSGVVVNSSVAEKEADLRRMLQAWMDQVGPLVARNAEHWHMLQKVFVADLDPQRLANARRKAGERRRAQREELA